MPISLDELFDLLMELCKIKGLKATTYSSVKGGLIAGAATVVGGLLLGKYGLLLGGVIGGGASTALANDFKPVWMVLKDLPHAKKQELFKKMCHAFRNVGIQDLAALSTLLLSDVSIQTIAIREISRYLHDELNLTFL